MATKVEVVTSALVQQWLENEGTELWLQVRPRGRGDAMAAVNEAIWAANGVFDEDRSAEDPDSVFVEGPWWSEKGPVLYSSRVSSQAGLERWLAAFAEHLCAAGVAGKVTTTGRADYPDLVSEIPPQQLTTFLAYRIVDQVLPTDRPHDWNVDEQTTARIGAVVENAAFEGAETYLRTGAHQMRTGPGVAKTLGRYLFRYPLAGVNYVRTDPPRVVYWSFNTSGLALRMVYDPQLSWRERLTECIASMVALPEDTEVGFVQYTVPMQPGWEGLEIGHPKLPGTRSYHFYNQPHLLGHFVSDAHGAQVLTDTHLDRAHDLSDWSIIGLGGRRHLVQAADLAAWYAQPAPDPGVVEQARKDFGAMVLTVDDIRNHPAPMPRA